MQKTALAAFLITVCSLSAKPVRIHGYITDFESPKAFAIDDYKITTDDHLSFTVDHGDYPDVTFRPSDLRVGSELEVQGDFNDSTHELRADSLKVFINDNVRVKRSAVVETTAVLDRNGNKWKGVIHADGQTIRVGEQTHVILKEYQATQMDPGMSIEYEGVRNRDGSINATRLRIFSSVDGRAERKLTRENAPKVTSDGEISIRGAKYKLAPDAEAQSYVQRIGSQLVPTYYQHELTGGASRKNPFQFYLVANDDFNAHAFPDGTVLVNSGVLRVLTSEAQLAAVLGHEIAHATQEHSYYELQYRKKEDGTEKIYAGGAKGDPSNAGYARILENQADRLGLQYMVAAGYDPREAAEVWKQVARSAAGTSGFWGAQDDVLARRSYLLSELRNNFSDVDYQTYVRDREEFDNFAKRFGNLAMTPHAASAPIAALISVPPIKRTDDQPPPPPPVSTPPPVQRRYGANAVTITSTPAGADVLLNGRVIGKTPMTLPTGSVGVPYIITIQCAGYRPWTGQMVSVPGRTMLPVELFSAQ